MGGYRFGDLFSVARTQAIVKFYLCQWFRSGALRRRGVDGYLSKKLGWLQVYHDKDMRRSPTDTFGRRVGDTPTSVAQSIRKFIGTVLAT